MTADRPYAPVWAGTGVVLAALVLVACTTLPARARPLAVAATSSAEEDALALLAKADQTTDGVPYRGVRFLSARTAGGATTSLMVEVDHRPGQGTVVRVLGAGADRGSMLYGRQSGARGLTDTALQLLARHYDVEVVGEDTLLGRPAYVVAVRNADGSLAAQFWLDQQTALVLRREVRGSEGRIVRASAFIDLTVGGSGGAPQDRGMIHGAGEKPRTVPKPWQRQLRGSELRALRSRGWKVPRELAGELTLVDARRAVVDGDDVIHLSYSDGLSMVSVFVQRGKLATRELQGWNRGAIEECCVVYRQRTIPRRVTWSGGGHTYTVVADASPDVIKKVVTALPHADRSGGFVNRMARGFTQLGGWLNPFG